MAQYNGNRSGERKTASQKIAEQRRRKTALEEVRGPRLNGQGNRNMPRLSGRSDSTGSSHNTTIKKNGRNTARQKSRQKEIKLFPGSGAIYAGKKAPSKPIFSNNSHRGGSGGKKPLGIAIVIVAVLAFIYMLVRPNAVEVFVDGNSVGTVMDKSYTAEYINTTCTAKLTSSLGTNVEITSKIETKKVHAGKNDEDVSTGDYLLKSVSDVLKYNVEASAIVVNGAEMAVVSNEEAAQTVVDRVLSEQSLSYIDDPSSIVEGPEIEGLEFTSKFVDGSQILTADQAYDKLNGTKQESLTYTVQSGDSFGKIAAKYGLSISDLMATNPNISDATRISVGDEIKINATVPIIDIKVVTQNVDRSSGSAVIVKTTYINGVVQDSSTLESGSSGGSDTTADDGAEDDSADTDEASKENSSPEEETAPAETEAEE